MEHLIPEENEPDLIYQPKVYPTVDQALEAMRYCLQVNEPGLTLKYSCSTLPAGKWILMPIPPQEDYCGAVLVNTAHLDTGFILKSKKELFGPGGYTACLFAEESFQYTDDGCLEACQAFLVDYAERKALVNLAEHMEG